MEGEGEDDGEEINSRPQALTHINSPVTPLLLSTEVQLFLYYYCLSTGWCGICILS